MNAIIGLTVHYGIKYLAPLLGRALEYCSTPSANQAKALKAVNLLPQSSLQDRVMECNPNLKNLLFYLECYRQLCHLFSQRFPQLEYKINYFSKVLSLGNIANAFVYSLLTKNEAKSLLLHFYLEYYDRICHHFSQSLPQIEECNVDHFSKVFGNKDLASYLMQFLSTKDKIHLACSLISMRNFLNNKLLSPLTVSQLEEWLPLKIAAKSKITLTQITSEDHKHLTTIIRSKEREDFLQLLEAMEFVDPQAMEFVDRQARKFGDECSCLLEKLTSLSFKKIEGISCLDRKWDRLFVFKSISIGSIINGLICLSDLPNLQCINVQNLEMSEIRWADLPKLKNINVQNMSYIWVTGFANTVKFSCDQLNSASESKICLRFKSCEFKSILSGNIEFHALKSGIFDSIESGTIYIDTTNLQFLRFGYIGLNVQIFFYELEVERSTDHFPELKVLEYDEDNIKNKDVLFQLESIKRKLVC